MTKVKICGITNLEDARAAVDLGADALGFNFFAGSPRYIQPADAQNIVRELPPRAWCVGVFVNSSREEVEQIYRQVGLDTLQFHGDEDIDFLSGWDEYRVIRAVRLGQLADASSLVPLSQAADYLLLDSHTQGRYGGTGTEISQTVLDAPDVREFLPVSFLAGGLSSANLREKLTRYRPFGVDVASGVEITPGRKSYAMMKEFIQIVRAFDAEHSSARD